MRVRCAAVVTLLGLGGLLVPRPATPQARTGTAAGHRASAYLPLGHWAYPVLDYWISLGRVDALSPFVRPYRRIDVAGVVDRLEQERLDDFEEGWLFRLQRELEPELAALRNSDERYEHVAARFQAGAAYRSQTHRDPLRPELEGRFSADRLLERAFLEATGQLGLVAGGVRVGRDGIFLADAQFPDGRVVPEKKAPILDELGLRAEEAYLELQSEFASLFFGRLYRNWAPPGLPGLLRSDYAYTEEEIAYRVGTDRVSLMGSLASLSDFGGDTTRYLSTHRLEVRPADDLVLAVTEAVIHGGPSQPLVFTFVNPVGIWHNARSDADPTKNAAGTIDLWWRPVRGLALYGSWLLDATGRSRQDTNCCAQGASVGIELPTLAGGWLVRARASAVQSLAYRTFDPWEEWSVERVGLGWDKSDVYLFTLEADWLRRVGLLLRPRIDLQLKGEGDFRKPRPPPEVIATLPDILLGEVETTLRPAVAGRWRSASDPSVDVQWDLGINFIQDHGHVEGVDRTEVVATVRVVVETPRWLLGLRE